MVPSENPVASHGRFFYKEKLLLVSAGLNVELPFVKIII